jgi:molecular chaperone DnaJ
VEIPTQLTPSQKELIVKLAEELGQTVHPQQATFMEKLRALFE